MNTFLLMYYSMASGWLFILVQKNHKGLVSIFCQKSRKYFLSWNSNHFIYVHDRSNHFKHIATNFSRIRILVSEILTSEKNLNSDNWHLVFKYYFGHNFARKSFFDNPFTPRLIWTYYVNPTLRQPLFSGTG